MMEKESKIKRYMKISEKNPIKEEKFEANPDQFVEDEINEVDLNLIEKIVEIGQQKKIGYKDNIKSDRLYEIVVNHTLKASKCFAKVFGLGQNYTGKKILDGLTYLELPYDHKWIAIDAKSVKGNKKYMFDEISNIRILRAVFEMYKLTKRDCEIIIIVSNGFSERNIDSNWHQFTNNGKILVPITSYALKIITEKDFTNGKFWNLIKICFKKPKIIDEDYVKTFI